MAARLANVTTDCDQPLIMAAFWSAVLDRPVGEGASEFFATIPGDASTPNWFFTKVPEAKTAKNRVHFDLESDDVDADRTRVLGLGATAIADKDEWGHQWCIFQDPEGNEFCMSGPHN